MPDGSRHALDPLAVARHRFARQHLQHPAAASAEEVVAAFGAIQAQDYAGAKWAIAQRTTSVTSAELDRALDDGTIVRTHVLRPTWHLVLPSELRWMLALTAPRIRRSLAYADARLGLSERIYARSNAALARATEDGRRLTRAELARALAKARIEPESGQRLAHLIMRAELDAVLCSGGRRGKQLTYASFDERIAAAPALDRDQALARLARLYFAGRSPATARDMAWWSGLTIADAKRAIAAAGPALEPIHIAGVEHWVAERPSSLAGGRRSGVARLLPNYDELFVGFAERGAALQRVGDARLMVRGSPLFAHVVAIDGQIVAGWRLVRGRPSRVALLPAASLSARERGAIAAEVEHLAAHLGEPLALARA